MSELVAPSFRMVRLAWSRAKCGLVRLLHPSGPDATGRPQDVHTVSGAGPAPQGPPEEFAERLIVTGRLTGVLESWEYQDMMARLARLDEARIHLRIPEIRSE
jgi:hypothetical protein